MPRVKVTTAPSLLIFSVSLLALARACGAGAFKVCLDFFKCLALGFRKQEDGRQEVDQRKGREQEEDGRVSMDAYERQKDRGERSGHQLVDHQRYAHAV